MNAIASGIPTNSPAVKANSSFRSSKSVTGTWGVAYRPTSR